ncbi:MAG: LCP family protein [Anaerolineaceae bacterium]|nr:LCP family protein [Anaerolineaceae bacterium]
MKNKILSIFILCLLLTFITGCIVPGGNTTEETETAAEEEESSIAPLQTATTVFTTPITINTPIPLEEEILEPTETPMMVITATEVSEAAPTETAVEESIKTECKFDGTMSILLLGHDNGKGVAPFGADGIRLIKLDFENNSAKIFAFQSDLKLSSPNLSASYGITESRIGTAFHTIMQREWGDQNLITLSTNGIAQILYDNFAVLPDHYVAIDQFLMGKLIDKVGGIEINVPEKLVTDKMTFNSGSQTFNGNQAWLYMIYAKNTADEWKRQERQELVFEALRSKLLSPSILSKLPGIYDEVKSSVVSDFSVEQIINFMCVLENLPEENIKYDTFPSSMINVQTGDLMTLKDLNTAKQYVQDFLQ